MDDALRKLKDRKIAKEEFERIRYKNEEKMEHLSEKIRDLREQIHAFRE